MKNKEKVLKYIVINFIVLITIYLIYLKDLRICLIYNLFKIPCVGCGLTRAISCLLKGDIVNSIRYNLLAIPLIIFYGIYFIWYGKDLLRNENTLSQFLNRNKRKIIIICVIFFIVFSIRNINNPLLY